MTLPRCHGRKEKVVKEAGKVDEREEEEYSPLISVMPDLAVKMASSKPVEIPTQYNTEMDSNEGIYEVIM